MNAQQFSDLLKRYLLGTCTAEEKKQVEAWYNSRRQEMFHPMPAEEEAQTGEKIYRKIAEELAKEPFEKAIPVWRKYWWYGVAAATLLSMAAGGYFLYRNKSPRMAAMDTPPAATTAAIVPGGNKAVLTLADGSVIVLDSAANGTLSKQGQTVVLKKQDGELVYRAEADGLQDAPAFNIISTPRGGQYLVVLPDGSKVWLNAASSLRFPAGFSGKERIVQLTGEAYFEVVANKKMPFKVLIAPLPGAVEGAEVEVLGTHFNIMAYSDETTIKTTLLEGAVNINGSTTLKPGQQARLAKNGNMEVDENADTEAAVAWKNGRFQFNNADVQTVMRQIARWYDVDIAYAGKIPAEKFAGEIPRNSKITEVIKMLELSDVHCKTEGKKITILPSR